MKLYPLNPSLQLNADFSLWISVTQEEVKILMKLYKLYDKSSKGQTGIPFQTFVNIPDYSGHPFISRLTELFIVDPHNPVIYAEQFVNIASFLSSKAPVEQKRKCENLGSLI